MLSSVKSTVGKYAFVRLRISLGNVCRLFAAAYCYFDLHYLNALMFENERREATSSAIV